jgi:hypothetical protein
MPLYLSKCWAIARPTAGRKCASTAAKWPRSKPPQAPSSQYLALRQHPRFGIDLQTAANERFQSLDIPSAGREVKRGATNLRHEIHVGAGIKQILPDFLGAEAQRGLHRRLRSKERPTSGHEASGR